MENWRTEAVVVLRPVVTWRKEDTNVRHVRKQRRERLVKRSGVVKKKKEMTH